MGKPIKTNNLDQNTDNLEPKTDYLDDPDPDIVHDLRGASYIIRLLHLIRVKAKEVEKAEKAAAQQTQDDLRKIKKGKQVSFQLKQYIIIKLICENGEIFFYMRTSDYYIVAFQHNGRLYYFDDFKTENLGGVPFGCKSSYSEMGGGGGLGNATMNYNEFTDAVRILIGYIEGDENASKPVVVEAEPLRSPKPPKNMDLETYIARMDRKAKGRQPKPPIKQELSNEVRVNRLVWKEPLIRTVVVIAEGARSTLVSRKLHRSQMSRIATAHYSYEGETIPLQVSARSNLESAKRRKATNLNYYNNLNPMSSHICVHIQNWSNACMVAHKYTPQHEKIFYLSKAEEEVVEGTCLEDPMDKLHAARHYNEKIRSSPKLCYYLFPLMCKKTLLNVNG